MEWFVRAFLKSSLAWLGLGVTLGVAIAVHPAWLVYRPAHMHMNLVGFAAMMIYGVGYHVLPRFSGHPLHSRKLAGLHWAAANLGLATMVAGFALRPELGTGAVLLLAAGGALSAAGAYLFIFNVWRTIDGPARRPRPMRFRSSAPDGARASSWCGGRAAGARRLRRRADQAPPRRRAHTCAARSPSMMTLDQRSPAAYPAMTSLG